MFQCRSTTPVSVYSKSLMEAIYCFDHEIWLDSQQCAGLTWFIREKCEINIKQVIQQITNNY